MNQVPSSLNAESYGHIVEGYSIRRKMINAANQIASIAYNEKTSVDDVMDEAEKAVFNVSERRLKHDLQPIKDVLTTTTTASMTSPNARMTLSVCRPASSTSTKC